MEIGKRTEYIRHGKRDWDSPDGNGALRFQKEL